MSQSAPPAPDTVTLTIDGTRVSARKGTLIVEAARLANVEIPVFCYHPKLASVGACRMCLVEIEKQPRLQTACTTPVTQDLVVHTRSQQAIEAQNSVIELLLANHPLDCPVCDKGGECPLQNNTFQYGRGRSRFGEEKRHLEKAYRLSDRIVLDRERCIMCYRCVRFHQEIPGDEQLAAVNRGPDTMIGTLPGETYDSIFSGNTIELCPVGALTSRQYRFKARPWDLVSTPSVCGGCAVGCNLKVQSRAETVLRLEARENAAVDDGWLCDRGRFETLPTSPAGRTGRPMIRADSGNLQPATWQAALNRAADLLTRVDHPRLVASPNLTNEALWLLQTLVLPRLSGARPSFHPAELMGGPVRGGIAQVPSSKAVVLLGLDVWFELPVLALWVRKAIARGARLAVIGPTNGLARDSRHWIQTTRADLASAARSFLSFLDRPAETGPSPDPLALAAADIRTAGGPVTLLAHPTFVADPEGRDIFGRLEERLGSAGFALVGAPGLAANANGARVLAPSFAAGNADPIASEASPPVGLCIGDEDWASAATWPGQWIVASAQPCPDLGGLEVFLPLAHPYERQGSITNLEGRVQLQEGGAVAPEHARPDWGVVAQLVRALAGEAPQRLEEIRDRLRLDQPDYAPPRSRDDLVLRV